MGAITLTGDFRELEDFRRALENSAREVTRRVAKAALPGVQTAVDAATRSGRAPSGAPHAPRKDGGEAFATLRGPLAKASVKPTGESDALVVSVTRKIPRIMHRGRQQGARGGYMPPRPLIPEMDAAAPREWVAPLDDAARAWAKERGFDEVSS